MIGFYNINKPTGPTSHSIVYKVKRQLPGKKLRVGHAGTLDPFASGVLIVCVGGATRLSQYIQGQPKRYTAEVTLGATSTTADPEGEITPVIGTAEPGLDQVRNAICQFVGDIMQVPPIHSAIQIEGVRAYQLAREGVELELPARPVTISEINIISYDYPKLTIDVKCGCGTYIRSLARDIGDALKTGGYCSSLVRTEVGDFKLEDAIPFKLTEPQSQLINPTEHINWPILPIPESKFYDLFIGLPQQSDKPRTPGEKMFMVNPAGEVIAFGIVKEDGISVHPKRVFLPRQHPQK